MERNDSLPTSRREVLRLASAGMFSALSGRRYRTAWEKAVALTTEDAAVSIQALIDEAPPFGGTVMVPPGTHPCHRGLVLRSGVTLRLDDAAILDFSALPVNF